MTIASHLRSLNDRLGYIERCAECAPEGTYQRAKDAALAIDAASEGIMEALRRYGFKALNDDRLRNLEAAIYGYLLEGNPVEYGLMNGEGFGAAVDGPAADRVIANAKRDRDFLNSLETKGT